MNRDYPNSTRTDWSMIAAAVSADGDASRAEDAMERLARRYWPAVYAYVRGTGCDVHEAADLTQGFICDVVISRRLFKLADPKRGRFRSLLLTALQNYLREHGRTRRRRSRRRSNRSVDSSPRSHGRAPTAQDPAFAINLAGLSQIDAPAATSPEAAFAAQWTALLVRNVLEQVRSACIADGLEPHWTIFEHRVVRPMLFGDEPTPYAVLAERLDLAEGAHGPNMMVTVKRRFAKALYLEVCTTVDSTIDAEGELFELLRDLDRQ